MDGGRVGPERLDRGRVPAELLGLDVAGDRLPELDGTVDGFGVDLFEAARIFGDQMPLRGLLGD